MDPGWTKGGIWGQDVWFCEMFQLVLDMLRGLWVDSGSDNGSFGCTRRRVSHTRGVIPPGGGESTARKCQTPLRSLGTPFLQLSESYSETLV